MPESNSLYRWLSRGLPSILILFGLFTAGCEPKLDETILAMEEPTLTIMGRVMDEERNEPIQGATVYTGTHSTTTDGNGNFVFSKLPITSAGELYTLRARLAGYVLNTSQTVQDTTTTNGADESENTGNRTVVAPNLVLSRLDVTLKGYVYLPPTVAGDGSLTSNPAANVSVHLQSSGSVDLETLSTRTVKTDATGRYSFDVADTAGNDTYTLLVPSFTLGGVTYANATSTAWAINRQGEVPGPTLMLQDIIESKAHVVWTNIDRDGDPDNGEVNDFKIKNDIRAIFSEAMDTTGEDFGGVEVTLNRMTGALNNLTVVATVAVTKSWDSTGTILTLNPNQELQYGATYALTLRGYSKDGDFVRYTDAAGMDTGEDFAFLTEAQPSVAGWVGPVQNLGLTIAGAEIPLDWNTGTAAGTFTLNFDRPAAHTDNPDTAVDESTEAYLLANLQGYQVYAKKVMPAYLTDGVQDGDSKVEAIANANSNGEWVALGGVQGDTGTEPMTRSVALSAGNFNVLDDLDFDGNNADDDNFLTLGTEIFLAVASVNRDGIVDPVDQWAVFGTPVRDQDPPTLTSIQVSSFDRKEVTIGFSEPMEESDVEGATYTFVNDSEGLVNADDQETDPTVSAATYQLRDTDNDGRYEVSEAVLTLSNVSVIDNGDWIRIGGAVLPTDNRNTITVNTAQTFDATFGDVAFTGSNIGPRIAGVSLDSNADTVSITFTEAVNIAQIGTLTLSYRNQTFTSNATTTAANGTTIVYSGFAPVLNITTAPEAGDEVRFNTVGSLPTDVSDGIAMGAAGNAAVFDGSAWSVYSVTIP